MWWHKLCRPFFSFIFHLIPSGLRCPVFAARGVARLQKADRIPLALSRFLLRTAEGACKNRSAAPNTAPCFVRRTRSLCLPLLRLAASAAGSARLSCPLSGGSGPLTASFTAAPPGGLFAQNFAAHRQDLDSHPPAHRGVPLSLRDIPLRGISAVTSPSPSSFAGIVKCKAL